jgi:xanthine dehydrogenase/oxidase
LTTIVTSLKNCYNNRRWQYKIFNVITDTAVNTYARAPGKNRLKNLFYLLTLLKHVKVFYFIGELEAIALTEHIMERISYELEKDPVEVRFNNIDPQATETIEVVQTILKDSEYYKRKEEVQMFNSLNRWKKRGLRVAFLNWPAPTVLDYHVLLSVYHGDGTVVISHGGVEMGQGINTKVIQVVAYTLNISVDKIKTKPTSVEKNPNSYSVGGSRTTQSICFGAIKCCQIIMDRMNVVREELSDPTWEVLVEAAFNRGINLQASYRVTPNDQDVYRSAGAVVTEVELDILTGEHEILRVDLIEDVGLSVNPELDIGQVIHIAYVF